MSDSKIATGVAHSVPPDLRQALAANAEALAIWNGLTPLARNEWICWVEDAKKPETRARRIAVGRSKMQSGMRRPCCWAGCTHRT